MTNYNPFDIPALTYINYTKKELEYIIIRLSDNPKFRMKQRSTKAMLLDIALFWAHHNQSQYEGN